MKPSVWHRLDALARRLTPFAITLILVLVGVLPLHLAAWPRVAPVLALIAVYHWSVQRPELLPAPAVFAIGLLQDVLAATPIGVNALTFLAVHGAVLSQRRFLAGKPFLVAWLGFAVVAAGAAVTSWVLVSIYHVAPIEPRALAFQYLIMMGVFPLFARLFLRWQQAILGQG